jgi:hypothetical protein
LGVTELVQPALVGIFGHRGVLDRGTRVVGRWRHRIIGLVVATPVKVCVRIDRREIAPTAA